MIIHRGTLTLNKLKELASKHLVLSESDIYNPTKNNKAISVIEQADGNYKGIAFRNDKLIEVRAGDPSTVLTMIITHN